MNKKIITPQSSIFLIVFIAGLTGFFLQADWIGQDLIYFLLTLSLGATFFRKKLLAQLVLVFLGGFLYSTFYIQHSYSSHLPNLWKKSDVQVLGKVIGLPKHDLRSTRFVMQIITASHQQEKLAIKKVRLSWYGKDIPKIKAGQVWQMTVRLKKPHGRFNNTGFDYEAWSLLNGFDATGYVRTKELTVLKTDQPSFLDKVNNLRGQTEFLDDLSMSPLLRALLFGDKSQMDEKIWQTLQHTGTSHLLAISGLHLGLLALASLFAVRRVLYSIPYVRDYSLSVATIFAIAITSGYALLAGLSVPTQRAWLMLLVVGVALMLKRQIGGLRILLLVLWLVLMANPVFILSAGLWLSFVAVFWLVLLAKIYKKRTRGILSWFKDLFVLQLVLGFGLIPVLALFGFGISYLSLPANIIAVPVVSFIVLPALLAGYGLISLGLETVGFCFLELANFVLAMLWQFLSYLSQLPSSLFFMAKLDGLQLVSALLGGLILLLPRYLPLKFIGVFLMLASLMSYVKPIGLGKAKITVIDVGQGLAVLVETANHSLLYDVGAKYKKSLFKTTILPVLRNKGITHLDKLLLSHADNDHAGGYKDVLAAMPVKDFLSSTTDKHQGSRFCVPEIWQWDNVQFSLVYPWGNTNLTGNNLSCVLEIKIGQQEVLLLSDLEKRGELALLSHYKAQDVEVILVPHHGSQTSSSQELLSQLKPKVGIVSSGYQNRYHHPHPSVLARLKKNKIKIFNTAHSGAIEILLNKEGYVIVPYREEYGRFWHKK